MGVHSLGIRFGHDFNTGESPGNAWAKVAISESETLVFRAPFEDNTPEHVAEALHVLASKISRVVSAAEREKVTVEAESFTDACPRCLGHIDPHFGHTCQVRVRGPICPRCLEDMPQGVANQACTGPMERTIPEGCHTFNVNLNQVWARMWEAGHKDGGE